jgi:hypothetical protein
MNNSSALVAAVVLTTAAVCGLVAWVAVRFMQIEGARPRAYRPMLRGVAEERQADQARRPPV